MNNLTTAGLTLAFGLCATFAGIHTSPAASTVKKPLASNGSQIAHGKAIAESNGCNTCHTSNYSGKKGFSPSIRANGVTAQYTSAKFVRLIHSGITEDGGHVHKPMPVYPQIPAKDSAALYTFLKAQK